MLDASERYSTSGLAAPFRGEMCVGSCAAGLGAPLVGCGGRFIPTWWWLGVPLPSRTGFACGDVLVAFSLPFGAADGASLAMDRRA